ncbi:MAG TPA: alkaline phosphatase family protein [Ktedonobacterales bacterium]
MTQGWRRSRLAGLALAATLALSALAGCTAGDVTSLTSAGPMPRYEHIIVIVMENTTYDDIIGSSSAPTINALASKYGLATNYWAVAHPSEPNYVAMIGGDTFGIGDDNSYKVNAVTVSNLATQLEAARLTWKSYQQSMPYAGFAGETYPSGGNTLYASKHNPFMNFLGAWPAAERTQTLAHIVPDTQLAGDLKNAITFPNLAFISPDLCNDMHGASGCASNLTATGDAYVNQAMQEITASDIWTAHDTNTAVVVVWDEAEGAVSLGGPDGIAADGGHVAALVLTNHGPRGLRDNTPYNHYALLLSIQSAFGLSCLRNSCPQTGKIVAMSRLFAVSG